MKWIENEGASYPNKWETHLAFNESISSIFCCRGLLLI